MLICTLTVCKNDKSDEKGITSVFLEVPDAVFLCIKKIVVSYTLYEELSQLCRNLF